ncbi:hypothetical protein L7F22_019997 [Adiantum nelumboides]|nr:hypothetical protein [Adiantum nelumboides]
MATCQCSHSAMILAVGDGAMATEASSACTSRLSSTFLPRAPLSLRMSAHQRTSQQRSLSAIRSLELDQDTIVAISVGLAGIAVGIGIPVFYETQMKSAAMRDNDQPCFPCAGSGAQTCRFCLGAGNISVELGGGEKEVSKCLNCEGMGSMTCTTCQGSGIQPRYLDRREFKDDD